jgi:hypothetical protein
VISIICTTFPFGRVIIQVLAVLHINRHNNYYSLVSPWDVCHWKFEPFHLFSVLQWNGVQFMSIFFPCYQYIEKMWCSLAIFALVFNLILLIVTPHGVPWAIWSVLARSYFVWHAGRCEYTRFSNSSADFCPILSLNSKPSCQHSVAAICLLHVPNLNTCILWSAVLEVNNLQLSFLLW